MTNNRRYFHVCIVMITFLIGCGQGDGSDRSYDSGVLSAQDGTDADAKAKAAVSEEEALLREAGIEEGLEEVEPVGLMLADMTTEQKATKYSAFSIRYCSAYVYESQYYQADREFCTHRRVKVADCQDTNELLAHPLHKRYQDEIDVRNVNLAHSFGSTVWNGERWIRENSYSRYERSPYYYKSMYFHEPCEEVTETNMVSFNQVERQGTITAKIRGQVVAEIETDGLGAADVVITGKKNSAVVWTNSFNDERIVTVLDGIAERNDNEGIGHVVTFDLPLHNYDEPCDVNNSGTVTSLDQLNIINALGANGASDFFVDYNGDGKLDDQDPLRWGENCR